LAPPIRDPNGNIAAAVSFADTAMNLFSTWQEKVLGRRVLATEKISRKIFPVYEVTAH
jgi:hypothetical protein